MPRPAFRLRTPGGLTTEEIANGISGSSGNHDSKRLTRAKRKIRDAGIPFRVPLAHWSPERQVKKHSARRSST